MFKSYIISFVIFNAFFEFSKVAMSILVEFSHLHILMVWFTYILHPDCTTGIVVTTLFDTPNIILLQWSIMMCHLVYYSHFYYANKLIFSYKRFLISSRHHHYLANYNFMVVVFSSMFLPMAQTWTPHTFRSQIDLQCLNSTYQFLHSSGSSTIKNIYSVYHEEGVTVLSQNGNSMYRGLHKFKLFFLIFFLCHCVAILGQYELY